MEIKTAAIVLRALKYGESQMIVDLFTRTTGRVSFICHIPKSNKGKIKKQLFQPLTILNIVFDHRPQASLQHFRDLWLAKPFVSLPFDAAKLSISLFLAEFIYFATRDEQQNESLYDYIEDSLLWLDNVTEQFANFHLVFMMRLSRFIGFFPNLADDTSHGWFDLRNSVFTGIRPTHPDFLEPEEASNITLLMRMDYQNMHLFRLTRTDRNRCTEIILHYYRLHVPGFPELKSLPVLQTLFR